MSALPSEADIRVGLRHVYFVPTSEISHVMDHLYRSDNHGLGLRLANLFDMGDLFDMAFRWIILAIIAAILAAEGYVLTSRYLYGPLNVIDWSGRVMTLEEKELLFQEVTRETMKGETDAPADMEFASIVRSTLDPLTVCGMARLRSRSGVWGSWQIIDIILPGDHPLLKATFRKSVLQGMAAPTDGHRLQYLVHDDHREITPQDSFKCEPITCEQKCDRYSWMPIATIE
jgi:hypothetical protein